MASTRVTLLPGRALDCLPKGEGSEEVGSGVLFKYWVSVYREGKPVRETTLGLSISGPLFKTLPESPSPRGD